MSHLIQILLPFLLLYKYWAIFSITFFAALILPIPPGTLLMASAAFASQGYLSFFWVVVVGSLGNIAGDNVGYFLARMYGESVLRKIGFGRILDNHKYKNIEKRIRKSPGALIFFSRFEVFSNLAVNIIAGLGKVPYKKYLLYESIGEIFQVTLYCYIGYLVGDNWEEISAIIGRFLLLIILVALVIVIIFRKRIWRSIIKESN
jgi:membrane protein DedA with SNARE-associated domain